MISGFEPDIRRKPLVGNVSTRELVFLLRKAMISPQPDILEGSVESTKSYYEMVQQFAAMAHTYLNLITDQHDTSAIFELIDFLLTFNKLDCFLNLLRRKPPPQ